MNYRIGIDVGGTNTDAVVIDEGLNVIASVKSHTTQDVMSGIQNAIAAVLSASAIDRKQIKHAMLGTTHCTNAIVERKRLLQVGIVRIGKPAGMAVKPMLGWPDDLAAAIGSNVYYVTGGHEFDGREIFPLDENELRAAFADMKGKVDSIAIISIFSPVDNKHELRAAAIAAEMLRDVRVTLSHQVASMGLLERENAAILNAALYDIAHATSQGFKDALAKEGVTESMIYICQNDGTLMSIDYAMKYPILTIACGPTNSIRGASFLSKQQDAIVLDVGGTTSDLGVVQKGFPRESSLAVEIGGARTNFRMPDIISIGLGGGSIVREKDGKITIGPDSVGYRIVTEALVFGGSTITATDIAVRLGLADIGAKELAYCIDLDFARRAHARIMEMTNEAIDRMKISRDPVPLVLVGGGSVLIDDQIEGVSAIIRPDHFGEANAMGAAISKVSGQIDKIYYLEKMTREEALASAKETAVTETIKAGADPTTIEIVDIELIPLAYLGNATRLRVKATGELLNT